MIDVHCHFAEEGYEFPAEWEAIRAAGVTEVILAADTLEHARMHRDFCRSHGGAFFTVGIHPEFAGAAFDEGTMSEFKALLSEKTCVAVGEIGLDYHYPGYDKAAQQKLFVRQLALAEEAGLPVQIHSRDACADTLAILREARPSGGVLMHCYSYGRENLGAFLSCGAYFSFGGVICFKNARRAEEAAGACPKGRLLSETDSPYLSPLRGEKNSPRNLPLIVQKLAAILGLSLPETERLIEENARRLFPRMNSVL